MRKRYAIAYLFSSLLLTACADNSSDTNKTKSVNNQQVETPVAISSAPSSEASTKEMLADCWADAATEPSLAIEVKKTADGGAKVVFKNWDKMMKVVERFFGANYPYDAPFEEEQIHGLLGKVKGVCVKGSTMSPSAYFLLEDNRVQIFSLSKLVVKWDFWAGAPISDQPVKEMKSVVKDYECAEAVLENGQTLEEDAWMSPIFVYQSYFKSFENDKKNRFCCLSGGIDGSFHYSEGPEENIKTTIFHGYFTRRFPVRGSGMMECEYQLTSKEVDGKITPCTIKGSFREELIMGEKNRIAITPMTGLNLLDVMNEKMGAVRNAMIMTGEQ